MSRGKPNDRRGTASERRVDEIHRKEVVPMGKRIVRYLVFTLALFAFFAAFCIRAK